MKLLKSPHKDLEQKNRYQPSRALPIPLSNSDRVCAETASSLVVRLWTHDWRRTYYYQDIWNCRNRKEAYLEEGRLYRLPSECDAQERLPIAWKRRNSWPPPIKKKKTQSL